MADAKEPALDEVVWRAPQIAQNMGGIHTNTSKSCTHFARMFEANMNSDP